MEPLCVSGSDDRCCLEASYCDISVLDFNFQYPYQICNKAQAVMNSGASATEMTGKWRAERVLESLHTKYSTAIR